MTYDVVGGMLLAFAIFLAGMIAGFLVILYRRDAEPGDDGGEGLWSPPDYPPDDLVSDAPSRKDLHV